MSDKFKEIYSKSIEDPEYFWREASDDIFWFKKPTKILNTIFLGYNFFWNTAIEFLAKFWVE